MTILQNADSDTIVARIKAIAATDNFVTSVDLGRSLTVAELPALFVRQPDGTESRERLTIRGTYLSTYIYRLFAFYALIPSPKQEREIVQTVSAYKERLPALFADKPHLELVGGDGLVFACGLMAGDQVEVTDFHHKSYAMIPYDFPIKTIEP